MTRFRNRLYNIELKKSFQFDLPIISVGNLSVGGTGKTPMVALLIDYLLAKDMRVATLSRGYGRKTKGFRICGAKDTPTTVGDEPYTYYLRYGNKVTVAVGEDRVLAVPFLLAEVPAVQVILLDDAYQHRSITPDLQVLLTTASNPFWKDLVMPAGKLRESRAGYRRADVLVVTKTSEKIDDPFLADLELPYFFTEVTYKNPILFNGMRLNPKVVAVAGLADNEPFFEYVSQEYDVVKKLSFRDHHHYCTDDIARLTSLLSSNVSLITTEKDAVKFMQFELLKSFSCAYIPIDAQFLSGEKDFFNLIDTCIS